jgi:hypothetical protein
MKIKEFFLDLGPVLLCLWRRWISRHFPQLLTKGVLYEVKEVFIQTSSDYCSTRLFIRVYRWGLPRWCYVNASEIRASIYSVRVGDRIRWENIEGRRGLVTYADYFPREPASPVLLVLPAT